MNDVGDDTPYLEIAILPDTDRLEFMVGWNEVQAVIPAGNPLDGELTVKKTDRGVTVPWIKRLVDDQNVTV